MDKMDVVKSIALIAAGFVPGGQGIANAVNALTHRDNDPTNDYDEVGGAIVEIAVSSLAAAEGLTGKDLLDDPLFAQVANGIKGDVKLLIMMIKARNVPK